MKRAHARTSLLAFCGIALTAASPSALPAKGEPRIVVLLSQGAAPYQEALQGFLNHIEQQGIRAQVDVRELRGDGSHAAAVLQQARQDRADLVLALGSIGAQAAVKEARDLPLVAGLVLNADDLGNSPNATAVVLEFPVETELRFLQRILPGQRNVGVLFNPTENQARIEAATRAAAGLGLTMHPRKVESPRDLPEALEGLNKRADVLWGGPVRIVLISQTANPILLFSLPNPIPLPGLPEPGVRAG